jgi:hypothetical protein
MGVLRQRGNPLIGTRQLHYRTQEASSIGVLIRLNGGWIGYGYDNQPETYAELVN